jgi:hypothetical protein
MNLHVFNDEYGMYPNSSEKFIRETSPDNNKVINIAKQQTLPNPHITLVAPSVTSIKAFINTLSEVDKIILHPLNYETAFFLLALKKVFPNATVYWVCWSYEIYNYHFPPEKMYLPYALRIVRNDLKARIKNFIKKNIIGVCLTPLFPLKSVRNLTKAYAMVDYFASFLEEDFYVATSITRNLKMQYLSFAYLSIDQIIDLNLTHDEGGKTIMLGHASSLESNHYEMISDVSKLPITNKILIPLAYGNEAYKHSIRRYAEASLTGPLEIMTEKLSADKYYAKLREVKHAVFNLRVQQGLGNLLGLVYMGAKIYLREETTTFKQFKKWGIHVYAYEAIPSEIFIDLTAVEACHNKAIILNLFNEKNVCLLWSPLLN